MPTPIKEDFIDPVLDQIFKDLPQLCQVQYDTRTQLAYLKRLAVKLGLYDAASSLATAFSL
jgi:hypothetical protein